MHGCVGIKLICLFMKRATCIFQLVSRLYLLYLRHGYNCLGQISNQVFSFYYRLVCKVWLYFPIYPKTIKPVTQGCQLQAGASTKKTQSYVLMHYAGLMSLQAWLLYCAIIITCIFYPWIMNLEDTSVVTLGFEF